MPLRFTMTGEFDTHWLPSGTVCTAILSPTFYLTPLIPMLNFAFRGGIVSDVEFRELGNQQHSDTAYSIFSKNKAPRRKQRGINCTLQSTGFQPAFAPRGGELNPQRLNTTSCCLIIDCRLSTCMDRGTEKQFIVNYVGLTPTGQPVNHPLSIAL